MEVHYEQNVYALNILQNKEVWELFKECHKKGGEKVRPYFEVKVVKAKKIEKPIVSSKEWTPDHCPCCGQRTVERKGNWVNGENLDKIEFPFFCSFGVASQCHGMVIKTLMDYADCATAYLLFSIGGQIKGLTSIDRDLSLKHLIEIHNIKVLRGKIILFEEE